MDPIIASAKAAVSGIKEAIAVGKEIDQLSAEIQNLGMAELAARRDLRSRERVVQGDTTIVSALKEYERLKAIRDFEGELRENIIKQHGKEAWDQILAIKQRKIKESLEEKDIYGRDVKKMRQLKWASFAFGLICTFLLWLFGML